MVTSTAMVDWAGLRAWPIHELANLATGLGAMERLLHRDRALPADASQDLASLIRRTSAVAVVLGALQDLEAGRDAAPEPVLLASAFASAGIPPPSAASGLVLEAAPVYLRATLCTLVLLAPDVTGISVTPDAAAVRLASPVTRFPPHPATRLLDLLAVDRLGGTTIWHAGAVSLTFPTASAQEEPA